jgi:hypothetical protein
VGKEKSQRVKSSKTLKGFKIVWGKGGLVHSYQEGEIEIKSRESRVSHETKKKTEESTNSKGQKTFAEKKICSMAEE